MLNQQKLLTDADITSAAKTGSIIGIKTATNKTQDLAVRASDQLEKWKAGELENEGGGKLTFRKLVEAFKEDPELAKHIGDEVQMTGKNVWLSVQFKKFNQRRTMVIKFIRMVNYKIF